MADVDLIPAEYAKRALVRRRMKPLLVALVGVALIIGLARLALYLLVSSENENIAQLQKQGQITARTKAEADNLRQQKQLTEKQLAELDELRGGDRLKLLLRAIDAAYSDSIWLDQLRFVRRDLPTGDLSSLPGGGRSGIIVVPKDNVPAAGAAPAVPEQRAELIGHATNHTKLAEFMRGLGSQPGIGEVRLVDTGLGSYANAPVIDLTLMLLVDDKARRPQ
jgi:Tfp pilus assembly protein PilN